MNGKEKGSMSQLLFTLGIVTLFLGSFLMLVVFSATGYRSVEESKQENNQTRELLSFISTTVVSNRYSSIYILQDDAADSEILLITDQQPQFGLRIYNYHNNLVADYGESFGTLFPQDAIVLGENSHFKIERVSECLLRFVTDQGETLVSVENLMERGSE